MANFQPVTHAISPRQRGFTLLEMLVALFVLSIGLLGLAGLQAQGLRYNHDAYVRSQATFLAYDIIERMRTNAPNVANYVGEAPAVDCGEAASVAENDRACWHAEVAALLPGGSAEIVQDATNSNVFTVNLSWVDRTTTETRTQDWTVMVIE